MGALASYLDWNIPLQYAALARVAYVGNGALPLVATPTLSNIPTRRSLRLASPTPR